MNFIHNHLKKQASPRILVYSRGELLGDGLLRLPFMQQLRKAYPQAHITWLAATGNTVVGDILWELAKNYIDTVENHKTFGLSWTNFVKSPWCHEYFDLIIDLQRRIKPSLIAKRIPHTFFVSSSAGWKLSHVKPPKPYVTSKHFTQKDLDILSLITGEETTRYFHIDAPHHYREWADKLLPQDKPCLILAPGAGYKAKCWPLENFIALGHRAIAKNMCPAFILGPAETSWLPEIQAKIPEALFPLQEAQSFSPFLTIALGELAYCSVSNDSGIAHILSGSKTHLITLFGCTSPEKWSANTRNQTILRAQDFGGDETHHIPFSAVDSVLSHHERSVT